ncbi:NACHT, LRR and PYD domains-containing protein 6-like isoform X2 [Thalassophryne amazonica]|uniref:NACHT, LRR and PYD domains-containing protein 6-like isoform X2 n=1 Tax=Thalassophryne amazonica TaxID=390379 RepID=UPI00147121DC|nr:NACHT, LRR and PYD domains-containing protein 6-like isoform X2 [Thalassophryne amazonica]
MDPDTEVESILRRNDQEINRNGWKRPLSSYGSMKSDDDEEEEKEEEMETGVVEVGPKKVAVLQRPTTAHQSTGLRRIRSESPETLYTFTTQETKPPQAVVIDTRHDHQQCDQEEEQEEILIATSPEPPEPPEPEEESQMDENGQPGSFHPEQDMPHIFKSILNTLKELNSMEVMLFKMRFQQWQPDVSLTQVMDGDILDLVDKIMEVIGPDRSLLNTINTLKSVSKVPQAEQLQKQCDRALIRYHLKQYLIRKHKVIREGVVQAGKQNLFEKIYVEPQISTCSFGGVDPSHELQPHPPSPPQGPSSDSFVSVNNLFRLQKDSGQLVRTVLTTGIPGIGMSVSVGKFCLDWAELHANRDLQFVFKLSFRKFSLLRNNCSLQKLSLMEVIEYYYPECKNMKYLEEEDCKFLIIMDCFDCYQAALDWKNAPEVTSGSTPAHPDVLIVNLIRGTLLPGACVWILGRRAAVSQIPAGYIDVVTEIQGFSDEMKDDYLRRRFSDTDTADKVVEHYKRLPTLKSLCRQPFVCWMVATVFERCFHGRGYGGNPPRVTPFYISILIVQTNRKLQFYFGQRENNLNWSVDDKNTVLLMGKMAFKMLEKKTSVFFEENIKDIGLKLTEVVVFSGLCTELPTSTSNGTRRFCFIDRTFQYDKDHTFWPPAGCTSSARLRLLPLEQTLWTCIEC